MVIARALSNLGVVAILRGEFERATTAIEEAITIQKALGDPGELAILCLRGGKIWTGPPSSTARASTFASNRRTPFRSLSR
jgi:hypothetical protein